MLLAAAFAVAGFVLVFFSPAEVDDRGDAIPPTFAGVYLAARSALTGTQVEAESASVVDAYGSTVIAIAGVPLLIGVGAFLAFRRWPASRTLTIAMLLMAAAVVFTGGFGLPFMPSLIALAVGSFQVRKTEAPTRRVRPSAADDEEPQDEDVADEYDEEFEDEDEFEDDGADLDDEPQDEPVYEDADIDDENPESDEDEGGSSSRRRGRRRQ